MENYRNIRRKKYTKGEVTYIRKLNKKKPGIRTIIREDFNARTEREGGGITDVREGRKKKVEDNRGTEKLTEKANYGGFYRGKRIEDLE